ncbi:MAG: long-chain fatty acid--CoA ligase [Candidatus Dormibacteraeota bacterium]|nr:long-chain fatty acid--CoA ligase [Candidatus Dormibacteraeota bacterium]
MSFNLATILEESTKRNPAKVAIILDDFKMTYKQLDEAANQVANALRSNGVAPGERVGIMLPNVPQFPVIYFGILKAGCVAVPMNVLLKAPEIEYYLTDSEASTFFYWDMFAKEAVDGANRASSVKNKIQVSMQGGDAPEGTTDFVKLVGSEPREFDSVATGADDICLLIYTSGTTGKPKGAALTNFNLFECCHIGSHVFAFEEGDVIFAALPMFHSFGLSNVVNGAIHGGITMSLLPRFDADKTLQMIQRDKITLFLGVPTMYFALLHHPERSTYDLSSLRLCVSGGASIPEEVISSWEKATGAKILEGYGLSETSPTATFNQLDVGQKVGSIGTPVWGVQVKIFDEEGKEVAQGERGEICIKGHNIMKEYWRNPEATAESIKDGWFHSGDIGYQDEEGFFFIVDRKKEMIIRGGFNVYPREIEEVIYQYPKVAEAAVIGQADEKFGEEVHAVVSPKPGETIDPAELQAFVKERVAAYKYPRTIQVWPELPKGPTGKIMKLEIKKKMDEGEGEDKAAPAEQAPAKA